MTFIATTPLVQSGQLTGLATGTSGTVVGTQVATNDTLNTTTHSVTFPRPFNVVPTVTLTVEGNTAGHRSVLDVKAETGTVTTTGFTMVLSDTDGSTGVDVNWVATVGL